MPAARREALKELAKAAAADPNLFRTFGTIEEAISRLRKIRGIGEWTAQYIALRALRETDAFPAADLGLLRGAELIDGAKATPKGSADEIGIMAAMARLCGTASLGCRGGGYFTITEYLCLMSYVC